MHRPTSFWFHVFFSFVLILAFAVPRRALGQDHVVTSSDLQKDVAGVSSTRQKNITQLDDFLSSSDAQQAMKSAHIDSKQVKDAVSQLSDDDLARLSARSEKAQKDFAAGSLSNRDLIVILLGIVVLILIIVAVR